MQSILSKSPEIEGFTRTGEWRYVPIKAEDKRVANGFEGASMRGSITLTSGAELPKPREGYTWRVTQGTFYQQSLN